MTRHPPASYTCVPDCHAGYAIFLYIAPHQHCSTTDAQSEHGRQTHFLYKALACQLPSHAGMCQCKADTATWPRLAW